LKSIFLKTKKEHGIYCGGHLFTLFICEHFFHQQNHNRYAHHSQTLSPDS